MNAVSSGTARAAVLGGRASPRRVFIPEVVQTSSMDCGPAALKSILGGFGVDVHYGRLREACRTSVDGTSIDTLEEVLRAFGLEAVQTIVPLDHVRAPEAGALPAIAVVHRAGTGNHFVVLWRAAFGRVQIMDPAVGRRWVRWADLEDALYRHTASVPTSSWLRWIEGDEFAGPLTDRLAALGMGVRSAHALVAEARAERTWLAWGALDAAARFWGALARGGLVRGGGTAERAIRTLVASAHAEGDERYRLLPRHVWTVTAEDIDSGEVEATGVLVVTARAHGRAVELATRSSLAPELAVALGERATSAESELARFLAEEKASHGALLGLGAVVASAGLLVQTVLLRHALDLVTDLGLGVQRVLAIGLIAVFVLLVGGLDFAIFAGVLHLGRVIETRLRVAFLRKIPRLEDRYFASRLSSDMAERSHMMHLVRALPALVYTAGRALVAMVLTTIGIGLLAPRLALWAALLTVVCALAPFAFRGTISERDLRARTHLGGLARHHLDALVGITALRAHVGEHALRREHEMLLVHWARAALDLLGSVVEMRTVQSLVGATLSVTLIALHARTHGNVGATLLLAYWIASLPDLAHQLATSVQQYPSARNVALRCLEPLGAPEAPSVFGEAPLARASTLGAAIVFDRVRVEASGRALLQEVSLSIPSGRHVAIVGRSGMGKSTLLGLLLGWHVPAAGAVYVDGAPLDASLLERVRTETAWVDPAVQVWNRSLLGNLAYGGGQLRVGEVASALEASDLRGVIERLPGGLQGELGEGGARLSGGEGQRVRFARALLKRGTRLAILDEPFRGLDREKRRLFLERARAHWKDATLLCVTHDVSETQLFDEVVVVEGGRIVEVGAPAVLLATHGSRYAELVAADEAVRSELWGDPGWRRVRVGGGSVRS